MVTNGATVPRAHAQRVLQVRAGGHGGGRAGRAAGLGARAAPAAAPARRRPARVRVRAARLRAARLLRPGGRPTRRIALLPARVPRHAHPQPHVVDRRRRRTGEPPRDYHERRPSDETHVPTHVWLRLESY